MNRRSFLRLTALELAAAAAARQASADAVPREFMNPQAVVFILDGVFSSSAAQAQLLVKLAAEGKAEPDFYGQGGVVARLEVRMAELLGKERAAFFPTGTMANRVALEVLAGQRQRVLLSRESHTYNDEADGPQRLSGLSLVPLAARKATFTLADIEAELKHFGGDAPQSKVGAIAFECPVRRMNGRLFDFAEMKRISTYARQHQIGLHLDGARLHLACAYSGVPPAKYAALVDTVYVSLYKYLNAPGGAILAGRRETIDRARGLRRVSGGNVHAAWPQAALALHHLEAFERNFAEAVRRSEELFRLLAQERRFRIERVPGGTNIAFLHVDTRDFPAWSKQLGRADIFAAKVGDNKLQLNINETILRRSPEEIARAFRQGLT